MWKRSQGKRVFEKLWSWSSKRGLALRDHPERTRRIVCLLYTLLFPLWHLSDSLVTPVHGCSSSFRCMLRFRYCDSILQTTTSTLTKKNVEALKGGQWQSILLLKSWHPLNVLFDAGNVIRFWSWYNQRLPRMLSRLGSGIVCRFAQPYAVIQNFLKATKDALWSSERCCSDS